MVCLGDDPGEHGYHPSCAVELFGTAVPPRVDVTAAKLGTLALSMSQGRTLSGAQRKVALGLDAERLTLRVTTDFADFILKPETDSFP
jgi:hypothetical protein